MAEPAIPRKSSGTRDHRLWCVARPSGPLSTPSGASRLANGPARYDYRVMTSIVIVAVLTQGAVMVGLVVMLASLVGRLAPARPVAASGPYADYGHDEGGPRDREADADSFRERLMAYRPQIFDQEQDYQQRRA